MLSHESQMGIYVNHKPIIPTPPGETRLTLNVSFYPQLSLPGFMSVHPSFVQQQIEQVAAELFTSGYALQDRLRGTLVNVKLIHISINDPETGASATAVLENKGIHYLK